MDKNGNLNQIVGICYDNDMIADYLSFYWMGSSIMKVYTKIGQYTEIAAMTVSILYTIGFKVLGTIIYQIKTDVRNKNRLYG